METKVARTVRVRRSSEFASYGSGITKSASIKQIPIQHSSSVIPPQGKLTVEPPAPAYDPDAILIQCSWCWTPRKFSQWRNACAGCGLHGFTQYEEKNIRTVFIETY